MITKEKAKATISSKRDEIAAVQRQFEKAADLGYDSVSSGFVFLQRTLGGLHERCMDKTRIVHDIAATLGCAYEEALPHVDAVMKFAVPRAKSE